jgi:hypothetical protein
MLQAWQIYLSIKQVDLALLQMQQPIGPGIPNGG